MKHQKEKIQLYITDSNGLVSKTTMSSIIYKKKLTKEKESIPYANEEAVDLIISKSLSHNQYRLLYLGAKKRHSRLYPSEYLVNKSRMKCIPKNDKITENCVEVPIDQLLSHTIERIIEVKKQRVIRAIGRQNGRPLKLKLYVTYGWDGAFDQARYNLKSIMRVEDGHLVASSLNYLMLVTEDGEKIFRNKTPGSVRFNRIIRLSYEKETDQLSEKLFLEYLKAFEALKIMEFEVDSNMVSYPNQQNTFYLLQCV